MEKQRVYVTSDASAEDLLEVIKKTGKKTSYVGTAQLCVTLKQSLKLNQEENVVTFYSAIGTLSK